MNALRKPLGALFDNTILVGTMTILVIAIAVYLSYIAENGLPFVPTYSVDVQVASAGQLNKNDDVRIGGDLVGQVLSVTPEPASRAWPHAYAQLRLSLQRSLEPLPADSHYQVRLESVLGGNYVAIIPGHDRHGVADGGTLALNSNPRLNHDLPFVDLDTALATFGPRTRAGIRGTLAGAADAVAGRGAQFNAALGSADDLLGPADRLLGLLAAPSTRLSGFLDGLAGTTGALAPVMPTVDSLLAGGAVTFRALTRPALGQTIDRLPGTEAVASRVLTRAEPVLAQAAAVAQSLKPAAGLLPKGSQRLDAIINAATPVFRQAPRLASALSGAAGALYALARDPASRETFQVIGSSDLGTLGASAFVGIGAILQSVAQAQFSCNVVGLWVRNFGSGLTEGNSSGGWLRFSPLFDAAQSLQSSTPAADLHLNYYPREDSSQCQAGNEVYSGTQRIGNPPRTSRVVDNTTPPPGALARGRKVGLVP